MKQHSKWFATALVVASGLTVLNSMHAQTISAFQNFTPTVAYANWDQDGWMAINGGAGIVAPTLTSGTTSGSFEINAGGYGSLHYDIPLADQQTMNPLAMYAVLTFTVNSPNNPSTTAWLGVPFLLDDNQGGADVSYGGYAGMFGYTGTGTAVWTGNTLTETVPLYGATLAAAQSGTGKITGFNVQVDPAVLPAANGGVYDLTYNSLVLEVPEPSTLALLGLGAVVGIVIIRGRAVKLN